MADEQVTTSPATTEPTVTTTPPATTTEASTGTTQGTTRETLPAQPSGTTPAAFTVPKEYAEKGWAKKVKSQDDVYKLLDNLDSLAGKKMVVPDFEKATPAELEEYFKQTRPKDKADYIFPEGTNKEVTGKVADILFQNGIPKVLGNKIITAYTDIEKGLAAQLYSKDGMVKMLKDSFGDDYEKVAGETVNLMKQHLSETDTKLLERMPNEQLGVLYRLVNNFKKAYGIKEGTAAGDGGGEGGSGGADKAAMRKSIRAELNALSQRPHTAAEKQVLVDRLSATYKQ